MEHPVDDRVPDVARHGLAFTGRRAQSAGARRVRREPGLGEEPVVPDPLRIDRVTRELLVLAQPVGEVRERVLDGAQRQPRDVVHRIAEVGELPVDDRGDLAVLVHEVAGTGVALDEDDRAVVVGHVALQPVEAEAQQGIDVARRLRRAAAHVRDLVERVLAHRLHRAEAREGEVVRVEPVERGEVADEVLGDLHLLVGILDPVEPVLARDALRQHRFVLGVHREGAAGR